MSFGAPSRLRSVEPSDARVGTPLGTMVFGAFLGDERLPISATFIGDDGLELRAYIHPSAEIELLTFAFSPKIPEHMRVDRAVAMVWRATAKQAEATLTVRARWEPGARTEDGGPECGERLTALTWYAPDAVVSLGTSDEGMLACAAAKGLLPARLGPLFDADMASFARFVGERDGLEIALPPLLAGETAQVHMVAAWREGDVEEREVSPWFTVDVAPWEIARMADEALGGSA